MKWFALMYAGIMAVIIWLADTRNLGFLRRLTDFAGGDKVGHFVLFGVLSLLVNLSVTQAGTPRVRRGVVLATNLVLAALIGLEEWSQICIAPRTFSLSDLAASYCVVAVFLVLALKLRERTGQSV